MSRGRNRPGNRLGAWLVVASLLAWLGRIDPAQAAGDPGPPRAEPGAGAASQDTSDTSDRREQARLHLVEGNRLFRAADFDGAAREYRAAHDLVASDKLHFNIGLAEKMRGNPVEAARELDRFLASEPSADADLRADAARYLDELSGMVASVQLQPNSAGGVTSVTVDGFPLELPPPRCPMRLAPGRHQIVVRRDAAPAWGRSVELAAGASLTLVPEPDGPPSPATAAAAASGSHLLAQGVRASPGASTPVSTDGSLRASSPIGATSATPPIYRRWWFWAGVAGVAGAGLAAAAVWGGRGDNGQGATCTLQINCVSLMKGP